MGGGNAQKSATSRQRNQEKDAGKAKGGGGKEGLAKRTGVDQGAAMAEAQG